MEKYGALICPTHGDIGQDLGYDGFSKDTSEIVSRCPQCGRVLLAHGGGDGQVQQQGGPKLDQLDLPFEDPT